MDQYLIVLNVYSISINKILVTKFITEKVSRNTESKFNAESANTVKSTTE